MCPFGELIFECEVCDTQLQYIKKKKKPMVASTNNSVCVPSLCHPLTFQLGGTKVHGEREKKGIKDVKTEK